MGEPSVAAEVGLLFRTKRVTEIRAVEAAVRVDGEERGAQLRALLGTRYRDLLGAAEKVAEARDAARDGARDALARVARDAQVLRAGFLMRGGGAGARSSSSSSSGSAAGSSAARAAPSRLEAEADLKDRREVSGIGGRLLCIVDAPEVLYACLEGGEVFEGALRFVTAERAYAALPENVVSAFVRGRWERVEAFRGQILAVAARRVGEGGAGVEVVGGCFLAEVVLATAGGSGGGREVGQVGEEALGRLLSARMAWVEEAVGKAGAEEVGGCVKVAEAVRDTVVCCWRLFVGEGAMVDEMLGALADGSSGGKEEITALRRGGVIVAKIGEWMRKVEGVLAERGAVLVEGAASLRELAAAVDAVGRVFQGDSWAAGCEGLGVGRGAGVAMMGPILCCRAKAVVGASVRRAAEEAVRDVEAGFASGVVEAEGGEERWGSVVGQAMRWKAAGGAGVDGGAVANGVDDLGAERARTGATKGILGKLEQALGDAITDTRLISERMPEVAHELRSAAEAALPGVARCLREKAELLCEETRKDKAEIAASGVGVAELKIGNAAAKHAAGVGRALFAARIAAAIAACEPVPQAFCAGIDAVDGTTPALDEFYKTVAEASSRAYEAWAARLCIVAESQLRLDLRSVFALELSSSWDGTSGRGAAVTGGKDEVPPPCPTAPSPGTLRFAMSACQAANRAGGIALPPGAIDALTAAMRALVPSVLEDTCRAYDKHWEARTASRPGVTAPERPENVNLQLLFDARFLSGLLLGCAHGKAPEWPDEATAKVANEFSELVAHLRARIDAINMASMAKNMDEAVDSYLARSSVLLGTLARSARGGGACDGGVARRTVSSTSMYASAGVLAIAPPVARFAYLPAPMPSTYSGRNGLTIGLGAKAAVDLFRDDEASGESKRDAESTVVDYASKLSENVGRFGRGFLDSWRSVGQ